MFELAFTCDYDTTDYAGEQQYADGLERQKILSVVCAEHCFADAVH